MPTPIRIVIADRQSMFREVLQQLLASQPDFEIAGSTDNGERLAALVAEVKPGVLLLEARLRRRSGIDVLRDIMASGSSARSILLTDEPHTGETVQALIHGARGILKKDSDIPIFFKAIRAVAAGEFWLSHSGIFDLVQNLRALAQHVERHSQFQLGSLTRQQRRIVEGIVGGCTNREIAEELSLSERTVKYHLTHIFRRLGVSDRMELARFSFGSRVSTKA